MHPPFTHHIGFRVLCERDRQTVCPGRGTPLTPPTLQYSPTSPHLRRLPVVSAAVVDEGLVPPVVHEDGVAVVARHHNQALPVSAGEPQAYNEPGHGAGLGG